MIAIHTHLGLGDAIDCNGMVRYMQKMRSEKVYVFAKKRYAWMVEHMYRDTDLIEVIAIEGKDEYFETATIANSMGLEIVRIGHTHEVNRRVDAEGINCAEVFYQMARIPFSIRYDMFYVERDPIEEERVYQKLVGDHQEYIFVHDDESRGMKIQPEAALACLVVKNDMEENPFHFIKIFENAKEIHCMESSLKSIIDSYAWPNFKLSFHDFRGTPIGSQTKNNWSIIPYDGVIRDYDTYRP